MIRTTMTRFCRSVLIVLAVSIVSVAVGGETPPANRSAAGDSRCFEMRTYYAAPGKLVTKVESVFMSATDYSPMQ